MAKRWGSRPDSNPSSFRSDVTSRRPPGPHGAERRQPLHKRRGARVKDLHSCRHTFCYYAGLYGIPLSIVQSIVGHMTPEMTKHYSAHASMEAKREKMKQLPEFMMLTGVVATSAEEMEREELAAIVNRLPIEKVRELLKELR